METWIRALTSAVLLTTVLHSLSCDCAVMTVRDVITGDLCRLDMDLEKFGSLTECLNDADTKSCTVHLTMKADPLVFEVATVFRESGYVPERSSLGLTPVYTCGYEAHSTSVKCNRVPRAAICYIPFYNYQFGIIRNSMQEFIFINGFKNFTRRCDEQNRSSCSLITYYDVDYTLVYIVILIILGVMVMMSVVLCYLPCALWCTMGGKSQDSKQSKTQECKQSDTQESRMSKTQESQKSQNQESKQTQTQESPKSQNQLRKQTQIREGQLFQTQQSRQYPGNSTLHGAPPSYQEALGLPNISVV